jgi:dipeptidyl aminopeptidase/acylaminoacyl peptidase
VARICLRALICSIILLASAAPVGARVVQQPYFGDRLAYISSGHLYVGFPKARLVSGSGVARLPACSYDGQWLAFIRQQQGGKPRLWLARADGSTLHRVSSVRTVADFQWSPSADVLAVEPMGGNGKRPILLVPAQGSPRTLPHRLAGSVLWSTDGRKLAVIGGFHHGVARFSVISGATVRSYRLPGASSSGFASLVGWWPDGHGLLYWFDPGGCGSCIADGVQLLAYDLQTHGVRRLGITLAYGDWIAASGNRLLVVNGGNRSAFFGKHLQLCEPGSPCRRLLPRLSGHISLDPAWSPNGEEMAFVVAPAWNTMGWTSAGKYRRWMNAHVLWTAQPDGSNARPAGNGGVPKGVEDPQWTRDGRGMLFVKSGALWLVSHLGASNAYRLVQLVPANSLPNPQDPAYEGWYYGHMDWHNLFAWY